MLDTVASTLARVQKTAETERDAELARARVRLISPRERDVLMGLLGGGTNKTIAADLGISPRTVELHRAGVMQRLGAETLPQLILIAAAAGLQSPSISAPRQPALPPT